MDRLRTPLCSADAALYAAVRRAGCLSHPCHRRAGAAELRRHIWPTAKYDLPRARQEASRPAATQAMITGPNPAFSRLPTWQISDAALTAATGARRPISRPYRRAVRAAKRYPAAWQATLAQVRAACRLPPPPATHIKRGSFICKNTQKALYSACFAPYSACFALVDACLAG